MATKENVQDTTGPFIAAGKLLTSLTRIIDTGATAFEQGVVGLGDLTAELTDASVNGAITITMHSEKLLGQTDKEIGAEAAIGREVARKRKAQRRKEKLARQAE